MNLTKYAIATLHTPPSNIHLLQTVQNLVKLLFDEDALKRSLRQMGLDDARCTPSMLTQDKILDAYRVCKELEALILTAQGQSPSNENKEQ